jgi:hypothetical protein
MMSKARLAVVITIAAAGVALIVWSLPPVVRRSGERTHADVQRALAPLINLPVGGLSDGRDHELQALIPNDSQWDRIKRRLGAPQFVIFIATDRNARKAAVYSLSAAGVSARARANGQALTLTATNDVPYGYSSTSQHSSLKFTANVADSVAVSVRVSPNTVPDDARLMISPIWDPLETWDWVDGAAMGEGLYELLAPFQTALGLVVLLVAIRVARARKTV